MINPLALITKAKRGDLTLDQVMELLSAAGVDADFAAVDQAQAFPQFETLAASASLPSAQLIRIDLRMKGGQHFEGLLVLSHNKGS